MLSMSAKNVTMTDQRSHYVRLDHDGMLDKEEIFTTFTADWRGEAVTFRMEASRYRHSSGVSEWRIYCTGGKFGNDYYAYNAKDLSDTARVRLAAVARPMMQAWLESKDYTDSYAQALTGHLKGLIAAMRCSSDSNAARRKLQKNADAIGPVATARITDVLIAFDKFQRLYEAL